MSSDRRALARRLLLEGLVIVASILLAFAVDASWDGFRDGQPTASYLEALEREFLEARAEMVEQIEDRTFQNLLLLRAARVSSQLGLDTLVLEATDEVLTEIARLR